MSFGVMTKAVGISFPVLLAWFNLSTVVWMAPFGWARKIRIKFGGLVRWYPKNQRVDSGVMTKAVGISFPVLLAWSNLFTVVQMVPSGWVVLTVFGAMTMVAGNIRLR